MVRIQVRKLKNDDAVSPVIGIMLMLVVTIVIAAVVAAFASGLSSDIEKAPNTVLDVKIYEQYSNV
ncbi:MAG: type IV pilin, partial [Methanocorpusculaceae archaeon]|nr:type IV pilin [Methanocorpusculaceae archaeon]